MKFTDRARGRAGPGRWLAVLLALAVGGALAILVSASPAAAAPPGGWCRGSWYQVETVHGLVHEQRGPTEATQNASPYTVNWTVSRAVSETFTTTATRTGGGNVSINLGIITIGVQGSTSTAVSQSMTVNTTTSVTVPVPPGAMAFAGWGVFKLHTSGTYTTITEDCDTGEIISEVSASVDAFSVVSNQPTQGWRVWG